MILYHGSYMEIPKPDLKHSRAKLDFGKGFYTTPLLEQAINWCSRFKRENREGIVSKYELDVKAYMETKVLRFKNYNEAWLDFIIKCRTQKDTTDYEIVIGGIANDRVFNTVELYYDGLIDKRETIKRLKYTKPNLQICLRTEKALTFLTYIGSEKT